MMYPTSNTHLISGDTERMARYDQDLLAAAVAGYEVQAETIRRAIAQLEGKLKGRKVAFEVGGAAPALKKHRISAEGRRRIAEAQRKRWAAAKGKSASKPAPKRKLSAEARARLAANLAKARAVKAAKKAAA